MHVCVIFYNIGGYHLARLEAAKSCCDQRGWAFNAVQIAGTTEEHPWGDIPLPDYVTTLAAHTPGSQPQRGYAQHIEAALRQLTPDCVAIPGWGFEFSRAALKWCRQHDRRAILMSESKYDDAPRSWWKEQLKQWLSVSRFDAALVGGSKHEDYLVQLGMAREKISRGYDIVDNEYFSRAVADLRRQGADAAPACLRGRKYFLSANRFIERKNLRRLVDAFRLFLADNANDADAWDLVLLGGGEQEGVLKSHAQQMGLADRVHFPGFVVYQEIPRWYAFAECFVHPALTEQWGLVVNEAMACGLPVLLSNTLGCYPELMCENENGFSFDPHSVPEMAQAMSRIAAGLPGASRKSSEIMAHFSPAAFGHGLMTAVESATRG